MRRKIAGAAPDIILRLAGEGGEGIISLGEILTRILFDRGWEVMSFQTFPPEIRGGPAVFDLRVGAGPVLTTGDAPDFLLALNVEAQREHIPALAPGGLILADAADREKTGDLPAETMFLPFTAIAREELGFPQGKNMVCLGALTRLFNTGEGETIHLLRERFGSKGAATVEKNLTCLHMGFKAMDRELADHQEEISLDERPRLEGRRLLTGNEAVGLGALAAGCGFFAGYPITPATSIMEFLADKLPCMGGHALQMEDEIAAAAACLGASYAGTPALAATSGPGLSLMTELLGLASMAEIPLVVVDVQRGGPSTGLPTRTEQSDLNLARFGMHGEGPRAVLAAADVTDCFRQTVEAFRLAETYQIPVILLSDQHLAYTTSPVDVAHLSPARVTARRRPTGDPEGFQRYAQTPDGISPLPAPGDPGFRFVATGLEHDPAGVPSSEPEVHQAMMDKRARKMAALAAEPGGWIRAGTPAPRGLITWGSTRGTGEEACARLAAAGVPVDHFHLQRLHPLPAEALIDFARGKEAIAVAELNHSGQLAGILEGILGRPLRRITSSRGTPFRPGELARRLGEETA